MMQLKRHLRTYSFIIFTFLLLTVQFQNCSQMKFADTEYASKVLEAERLALGASEEVVTVGLNPVPDLKLFFVVDNSGTMKENNVKLADAFGVMFGNSADSLNKFNSTTFLLNTAQTVPAYSVVAEKAVLDSITGKQASFDVSAMIPKVTFDSLVRTPIKNLGYLPGDNIGYQVKKTLNPINYQIIPAPVLGVSNNNNQISLSNSIRKPANADMAISEQEFKDRLAIMDAGRIPVVKIDNVDHAEHELVVDKESGLCAVARVLRNPDQYIKAGAGEMLSFTIVSDEDDNDPMGTKCVQSYRFNDNSDLENGECKFKESKINYQLQTTTTKTPDCAASGNKGYNFKYSYQKAGFTTDIKYKYIKTPEVNKADYFTLEYEKRDTSYTTDIKYKYIKTPEVNKADYFTLEYEKQIVTVTYEYKNTNISYYANICTQSISDGILKTTCVLDPVIKTGTAVGDYSGINCYALAKILNPNAVNDATHLPVCTTLFKPIATCNDVTEPLLCKKTSTPSYVPVAKVTLPGTFTAANCLSKAQAIDATARNAACIDIPTAPATCVNFPDAAAACRNITPAVIEDKLVSAVAGDKKTVSNCVDWAEAQSDHAPKTTPNFIVTCDLNTIYSYSQVAKVTLPGTFTAANCLAKAQAIDATARNATCIDIPTAPATCVNFPDAAAACRNITPAVIEDKLVSAVAGDKKTVSNCVDWAEAQSDHAPKTTPNFIVTCDLNAISTKTDFTGSLDFKDTKDLDLGNTLPTGVAASCGVLKGLANAKSPEPTVNDDCVLTGIKTFSDPKEALTAASCDIQATNKCATTYNRNCSAVTTTYNPVTTTNPTVITESTVKEVITNCATLCSDSKLNACGTSPAAGLTIDAYLKSKLGRTDILCSVATADVPNPKILVNGVLASATNDIKCPAINNVNYYYTKTFGPYKLPGLVVDYVAGTKKDANNLDVPVMPLVSYIKSKVQQMSSTNQVLFSAIIRRPASSGVQADPLGNGGTAGVAYKALIDESPVGGQVSSILANDYSIILKELSTVIKNNLERSFILKKMRPDQIITKVSLIIKGAKTVVELDKTQWSQSTNTLKIAEGVQFIDGDQFKIDFQNVVPQK